MRARTLAPYFAQATRQAAKFRATRTTLPITNHVLLETADGELWLTATDLETTITLKIPAQVEEPGALAIPAEMLSEIAAKADSEMIELATADDNPHVITVSSGRQSARISGLDSEDFPPIPSHFTMATATLDAGQFRDNAKQVLVNVAKRSDWRDNLQCVHFELSGDRVTMTAEDGFRLGVRRLSAFDNTIGHHAAMIPAETIKKFLALIPKRTASDIILAFSKSHVAFSIDNIIVIGTLSNANAPDYAQVIPEQADTDIVLNRADLLEAVKVADTFARRNGGTVRLAASGLDTLRISAKFQDDGGVSEVAGRIPAVVIHQDSPASLYISDNLPEPITGRPKAEVSINGAYLVGALAKLTSDNVCLGVSSPESAVLFTPMHGHTMDLDNQTVIMPIYREGREKLPEFNAWTVAPMPEPVSETVETAELSAV